jgi:hypothetical protein
MRRLGLTYANTMATVAVFIALGGTGYAAITVTGKQVKDGSLTGRDVKNKSLTGTDIRDSSLLAKDFKVGELPAGPQGSQGPQGPVGPQGSQGPQGQPGEDGFDGSALAGAVVYMPGPGSGLPNPSFWGNRVFGFTSVSRSGTGHYCLTLDQSLDSLASELVITAVAIEISSADPLEPRFATYQLSAGCNGVGVVTQVVSGGVMTLSDDVPFVVTAT